MKILIIGNGFDLAHGLPTTYTDYLMFSAAMKKLPEYAGSETLFIAKVLSKREFRTMHPHVRRFLLDLAAKTVRENEGIHFPESWLDEYFRHAGNIWDAYFQVLHVQKKMNGIGWIDLETEIRYVIECFDRMSDNLYEEITFSTPEESEEEIFRQLFRRFDREKIQVFFNFLKDAYQAETGGERRMCYSDLRSVAYNHLISFSRCFELYLEYCVRQIPIGVLSPDIRDLYPNKVLSFNYTDTFDRFYSHAEGLPLAAYYDSSLNGREELAPFTQYIHGKIGSGNLIFGIDEYGVGAEKDSRVNYNVFKKFVQRIIYKTGFEYREWISDIINKDYLGDISVYVFGHSLDITDKDILGDLITTDKVTTTVYFFSKDQEASQISNLIKMIGHDRFLDMVNSVPPRIIFREQQVMIPVSLHPSSIEIVTGNIAQQEADCIVNSTGHSLRGEGAVSNAIFTAAGFSSMKNACAEYGACATGACVVTPAFKLKAKYVIHAVGPIWKGGTGKERQKLYECYQNILTEAMKRDCHTVASPLISSGTYGFPLEECWPVAISACRDFFKANPDYHFDVRFVAFQQHDLEVGKRFL